MCHVVKGFFEETEPIHEFEEAFCPMSLHDDVLRKIFKENLMRLYNNKPLRKADYKFLSQEIEMQARIPPPTELNRKNLEIMKEEFIK